MKPDNLNNLSQKPRLSVEDSTTENNSLSSDSDIEDIDCPASDQKRIVQGLRKTIRKNNTKINDLVAKLTIAEMNLASEKEKSKYKDDLMKLTNENKDLSVKQLQSKILELENELALSKSQGLIKEKDKETSGLADWDDQCKKRIAEFNALIDKFECIVREKDDKLIELDKKLQIHEAILKEKDENINRLGSQIETDGGKINKMVQKLSEVTLDTECCLDPCEPHVFLNCTKIPSMKLISLPDFQPFAAVFEDIPSAGPGWMVIQRRFDGSVVMESMEGFFKGCGDLGGEFWIGSEKLHKLTSSRRHELNIELVDFDDVSAFARYDHFVVGSIEENYMLKSLGKYSGNAGDALRSHTNEPFYNNDLNKLYFGWWNSNDCNLNGTYYKTKVELDSWVGIWWGRWNMGKKMSLKSCKMLIRPKN
ncbi:angiopoietin-related protein 7 [Drosophila takahashii]|uniref:angiopoietin-related protein 7 n=1 Tax=Drosophila takahashii TaxID=29030 RepID=UPI003898D912